MKFSENVLLSQLTTFKIGGKARGYAACNSIDDIQASLALSRERGLPWYVIGGGSNLLVKDEGYEGIVIHIESNAITFEESPTSTHEPAENVLAIAEAGAVWDELVQESVKRGLWGLENLAGIPGSVGGAPVQNIGAYGADVSDTLTWVEAVDTSSNELRRFTNKECEFSYRESRFKHDPALIIVRVAFTLSHKGTPHVEYADLKVKVEAGEKLVTPSSIADAVREIRSGKFPDLSILGTAGSFIKNPTIPREQFAILKEKYPDLPGYETSEGVKIPIAWILDHVLNLRGYGHGQVRFYEKHALVIVAEKGATAHEVDELAHEIETLVFNSTGIRVEREVRML